MKIKAIQNPRNLKEVVYQRLKESILRGKLLPGVKLPETQIAQQLGVSRTPLREAINRLEQDGFVESIPRRGSFVRQVSSREILEDLEIREVLEGLAIREAAHCATPQMIEAMKACFGHFSPRRVEKSLRDYAQENVRFHHFIIEASQNRKLITLIRNLYDHMDLVRLHTMVLPGRAQKSLAEHRKLIRLIENRQGDLAERVLRSHIRGLRTAVLQLINRRSSLPSDGGEVVKRKK
jgi:DNA-binding GntR family transcriptional regulator